MDPDNGWGHFSKEAADHQGAPVLTYRKERGGKGMDSLTDRQSVARHSLDLYSSSEIGLPIPILPDGETEAQGGRVACSGSHNQ